MAVVFNIVMILVVIGLVSYLLFINQKETKRSHRMINDISERMSNFSTTGVELGFMPDPSGKVVNEKKSVKGKSKIEVGRDESITINLNRPMAPLSRERSL